MARPIAESAAGRAGPPAVESLESLVDALADPAAPTAVHNRDEVVHIHIDDSLAGLDLVGTPGSIADLGSGAGLPGLVLAAKLPEARVVCVEASRRKAEWIEATAQRCGLPNATGAWARAEEWDGGPVDVVVARAVAALSVLCEYAAPLLAPGGRAVFWKGFVDDEEAADGRHAAAVLGLSEPEVVAVTPYAGSERRSLWVFDRVSPVPDGYPRRPGIALKRPLRAISSR